jgi:long-chain acyl-CoA synthetase
MMNISVINRVAIGDALRRSARKYPDKTAIVDGMNRITFAELDRQCNQFAHYLLAQGLKKGDTVATICGNSLPFVIVMYGIAKAGLTWVPLNPGLSLEEKLYILHHSEAKLLVADEPFLQAAREDMLRVSPAFIMIPAEDAPFYQIYSEYSADDPEVEITDREVAQIMYTSGTTGMPKGVMISHLSVAFSALSNIIELDIKPHCVQTVLMPLFHCAQHTFLQTFVTIGGTSIILKRFEPESLMRSIQEEKITNMFALPMMYRMILAHPNRSSYDLSSLQSCLYAMAPMDQVTLETAIHELKADFSLGTGQTEIYPATMIFKPEDQLRKFGSYWGTSTIMNDTAVMDEEGNLLPPGQIGEIVHRGPNVMNGYLKNEEATEMSRAYGWHHTGDLGYFDEDGLMVFVDRKKDMIKTGGENVASIRVEQVMYLHKKVASAAVVGLPHEHWNEAVTAFVIPVPGESLTQEELLEHCKQHLAGFQIPKRVKIVEKLPMTTTGKIQKSILREQYKHLYQISDDQ